MDEFIKKKMQEAREKLAAKGYKRTKEFGLVDTFRVKQMLEVGTMVKHNDSLYIKGANPSDVMKYITGQSNYIPTHSTPSGMKASDEFLNF